MPFYTSGQGISYLSLLNCTFYRNSNGIGAFADDTVIVRNCTITNSLMYGIAVISGVTMPENYIVSHNNSWNNFLGNWSSRGEHSYGVNVAVNAKGDSCDAWFNISENPHFVNEFLWDFNLRASSPLIDAGCPSIRDPDGTVSDIGALYFHQGDSVLTETQTLNTFGLKAYPNPFNHSLQITFHIQQQLATIPDFTNPPIEIYAIDGKLINRLHTERNNRIFSTTWDGKDYQGNQMPSAIYMVSLNIAGYRYMKRVSLVR